MVQAQWQAMDREQPGRTWEYDREDLIGEWKVIYTPEVRLGALSKRNQYFPISRLPAVVILQDPGERYRLANNGLIDMLSVQECVYPPSLRS